MQAAFWIPQRRSRLIARGILAVMNPGQVDGTWSRRVGRCASRRFPSSSMSKDRFSILNDPEISHDGRQQQLNRTVDLSFSRVIQTSQHCARERKGTAMDIGANRRCHRFILFSAKHAEYVLANLK